MNSSISTSIDPDEIEKFSKMADEWWDEKGKFKPLHKFNPIRLKYIIETIKEQFFLSNSYLPLNGLKILDVGCGGGLLCEPLARLGASVTGIDMSEKTISIASLHAKKENLDIEYLLSSAEDLASKRAGKYDVVLNMEVIEHIADTDSFIQAIAKLTRKDGLIFNATLNKTIKSYLFAIVGAEYILNWLPKGTHSWQKFIKPIELVNLLEKHNCVIKDTKGVEYNPIKDNFYLSNSLKVNYMILATRL